MPDDDSSDDQAPQTSTRPCVVYSRAELLHLSKSPLVAAPDGMPGLTEWFGNPQEASPVMSKRDPKDLAGDSGPGRERRFRRDDDESGGRPYRPNLPQASSMGSFRLQPLRSEGDRVRNLDSYDKERPSSLATSALALRRDRDRERDTAPHLSKREPGLPLRGTGPPLREGRDRDRDPGRETAADRAADRERAREAGRRRKEEELGEVAPRRERGRAGESEDWRSKDRREREAEAEREREERERELERERGTFVRRPADTWQPEPDRYDRDAHDRQRYDRDRRDRDRDRERDWVDRESVGNGRERSRERNDYPPRSSTGRTPWDTDKERAAYERRRREERDEQPRRVSDRDRERERDINRERPARAVSPGRRRSRSRQRTPSPPANRRRRAPGSMRDEPDEKEPAWATDDNAPVGGLRGILGTGEDKLQAWKRQMKEAERMKNDSSRPSNEDDEDGEDRRARSPEQEKHEAPVKAVPPGLALAIETTASTGSVTEAPRPQQAAEPPLPLHLRLAGSSKAFRGLDHAQPSAPPVPPTPATQSVADRLADLVSNTAASMSPVAPTPSATTSSLQSLGQPLMTPNPSSDMRSPPEPRQMSVQEFFEVAKTGAPLPADTAARVTAELNRPPSTTTTVPPPATLLPSPTPTLPPTTAPFASPLVTSPMDEPPRSSRFAKLWDNRAPALPQPPAPSAYEPPVQQSREDALIGMFQNVSIAPQSGRPLPQTDDQQRMQELLSSLRLSGQPNVVQPSHSQARTSPLPPFSTSAGPQSMMQSQVPQYASQREHSQDYHEVPSHMVGMGRMASQPRQPQNQYEQLYEYQQQQMREQQAREQQQMRELREAQVMRERELALRAQREQQMAQLQRERLERHHREQEAAQREQIMREQMQLRAQGQYRDASYDREQQEQQLQARQFIEYQQRLLQQQASQQAQQLQRQPMGQPQSQQPVHTHSLHLQQVQQQQQAFSPTGQMDINPYERRLPGEVPMQQRPAHSPLSDVQRDRSLPRHPVYEHLPNPPASLPQRPPSNSQSYAVSGVIPGKAPPLTPGSMFPPQQLQTQQAPLRNHNGILPIRPQPDVISPQSQYLPSLSGQQTSPYTTYPSANIGHQRTGTTTSVSSMGPLTPSGMGATTPGGMDYALQQQQQQQLQAQRQQQQQQQLLLSQFQTGMPRGGYGGGPAPPLMQAQPQQQQSLLNSRNQGQQLPPHLLSGMPPQF